VIQAEPNKPLLTRKTKGIINQEPRAVVKRFKAFRKMKIKTEKEKYAPVKRISLKLELDCKRIQGK
jgi:hypothetical protein